LIAYERGRFVSVSLLKDTRLNHVGKIDRECLVYKVAYNLTLWGTREGAVKKRGRPYNMHHY
jgi:hypothetical protein